MLPDRVQLGQVEHFRQFLQLVFLFVIVTSFIPLAQHPLKRPQIRAFFRQTAHVDLRANVVSQFASTVAERGDHEQIEERRAIAATSSVSLTVAPYVRVRTETH